MGIKKFVTKKLGVDKAIFYTVLGRCLQMSAAIVSLAFIVRFLSPVEQGYYYTFGSIVAMQVFFELGFTGIITQFVAHEAAHLTVGRDNIEGDHYYMSRLSSLMKFCAKWYLILALVLFVFLTAAGIVYFGLFEQKEDGIAWQMPWVLLVCATMFNLFASPLTSYISGLGKVKEVAKFRLVIQIVQPLIMWGCLYLGADLYVPGIDAFVRSGLMFILILRSPIIKILIRIWKEKVTERISYMKEVFPYQWRIAVSWISGYFIFQFFNPVLFATEGAVVAGQMGLTQHALNSAQALCLAWINTKVPKMSGLIATKKHKELDALFGTTIRQICGIGIALLTMFVLTVWALQYWDVVIFDMRIGSRFLPFFPLLLMTLSVFTMMPVNCWATYLRCHKKEPLLVNSVVIGVLCCISTVVFGKYYGLYGICIGYIVLRVISLTWINRVYNRKKHEWHRE